MKEPTGKVKIAITLRKEVFNLLEEMCRRDTRSKSREISWLIRQSNEVKFTENVEAEKENRIICPPLSVWKKDAV